MAKKISDEKLLETLIIHNGVRGAAAVLGISQNAIYKRLKDDSFRQQYDSMQGVMLSTAVVTMTIVLDEAIAALREVITDPNANPNTRVSAAHSLLTHCNRYVETASILRRLDALEAQNNQTNY